jgi:uncharacterized membrane protein YjgN (DUF898 family)
MQQNNKMIYFLFSTYRAPVSSDTFSPAAMAGVKLIILCVALSVFVPASMAQVMNVYAEAAYFGATDFITYVDKAKMTKMLKDPTGLLSFVFMLLLSLLLL